jgi:hypothetical protein
MNRGFSRRVHLKSLTRRGSVLTHHLKTCSLVMLITSRVVGWPPAMLPELCHCVLLSEEKTGLDGKGVA